MLRVLIVDDSTTSRLLLNHVIGAASDMQVVGQAKDGIEAVEMTRKLKPDVILMDIVMPQKDGLEATEEIMSKSPTPIVMISGAIEGRETEMAFKAIKKGALTLLSKPVGPGHPDYESQVTKLTNTIRAMAGVRVIHHVQRESRPNRPIASLEETIQVPPEIVAVAASTGGPAALAEVFQNLPAQFPLPIVVVQHIAGDFLTSLTKWLNQISPLNVCIAEEGEVPLQGNIYFAPFGKHLCFSERRQFCQQRTPITYHTPSADVLFESVADRYGAAAIGVILTGMGADGAAGLLRMSQKGAVTIAQDEQTCAVYGMPKEAVNYGAVKYSLAISMIPSMLNEITKRTSERFSK